MICHYGENMKIKVIKKSYTELKDSKSPKSYNPIKPNIFFRTLMKVISQPDLISAKFKYTKVGMEKLGKKEPALILMNHSSFIDVEIAQSIFYPRPMNIVCTNDGFIGKNWLMRHIGCISTPKFVSDPTLVRKIARAVKKNSSILMFPEAGYSFDGTMTVFPASVAKLVKFLKIPVVTVITSGAYLRQPLYNELRKRKVKVSAEVKYLLSKEEILSLSEQEIFERILHEFSFDSFKVQQENNIIIDDKERAVGLNRLLYKCPHCGFETGMVTEDDKISCPKCHVTYTLTPKGYLECINEKGVFNHIPDWYKWQREKVKEEIINGTYKIDEDVKIYLMKDTFTIYEVGEGHLTHDLNGFHLVSSDGSIDYKQSANISYTINSDFFWYQIADTVCIGDYKEQFYCFFKEKKDLAAKARLATEEMYKILRK